MEMHQISYFVALCRELNFTRAARRCSVSQPSLTRAIKRLEADLHGPLFHRSPRPRLTERGEALRPLLESILQQVEEAKQCAASLNASAVDPSLLEHHTNGTAALSPRNWEQLA